MSNNVLKQLFYVILLGLLVCCTKYAAWIIEDGTLLSPPSLETFSSLCQDQMVKVDSSIYHLDRLRSSLKSDYFERLFYTNTSDDFELKNGQTLEIQIKNGELFPHVIDLIYERKQLINVLSKDNYLPLLEMMNHLEMELDLEVFSTFIDSVSYSYSPHDAHIFELYHFIEKNYNFEYLLTSVFKYLAKYLPTLRNHEIFPSMPLGRLIRIIKSVYANDEGRCEIVKTCTKWLCYNLDNRLPHLVILVNSIKPTFHFSGENYENNQAKFSLCKSNIDKKAKRKIVSGCLFALLAHGGKLNPTICDQEESQSDDSSRHYIGSESEASESDCGSEISNEKYETYYDDQNSAPTTVNRINEFSKWKKFLKNGNLYDITVRVREKTYKLHRAVLESKCGYFADIFRAEYAEAMAKCDGTPTCPCKDKEYLLDSVDPLTFDEVIEYIYLRKLYYLTDNIMSRIFKAADILKIDTLLTLWVKRLNEEYEMLSLLDVVEILNYTYKKEQYDELYLFYLSKHMSSSWPEIYNMSQFCSISWSVMEKMLKSPHFHFDDRQKIVDICSTWVFHDIKNRYSFLPRIAELINPNCLADRDEYKTKAVVDLNNRSLQFVRDELWQFLSILPYNVVRSKGLKKSMSKKFEEIPVFVGLSADEKVYVFNANLDNITSFSVSYRGDGLRITSATMINDNIFMLACAYFSTSLSFMAYNFSLKKSFLLLPNFVKYNYLLAYNTFVLLNCNNELYCCSSKGDIRKFSMQLNQWVIVSKGDGKPALFTSDGQRLYRIYQVSNSYVVEPFDFEKKVWSRESSLPLINDIHLHPYHLNVVVNGHDLVTSTFADIYLFESKLKTWRHFKIPQELWDGDYLFTQCEDKMLLLKNNKLLYNFSYSNNSWELKREVSLQGLNTIVIHNPAVRTNQFC